MPRTKNYGSPARVVKRTLAEISINPADYILIAVHGGQFDAATYFVNVRAENGHGVWSLLVSKKGDEFGDVSVCFRTGDVFNTGPGLHLPAPAKVATLAIKACRTFKPADFEPSEGGRVWRRSVAS